MARFDALPTEYSVNFAQVDPESGEILIFYETRHERPLYVIERWQGSGFRGSSDWMAAGGVGCLLRREAKVAAATAKAGSVRCEAVVLLIF